MANPAAGTGRFSCLARKRHERRRSRGGSITWRGRWRTNPGGPENCGGGKLCTADGWRDALPQRSRPRLSWDGRRRGGRRLVRGALGPLSVGRQAIRGPQNRTKIAQLPIQWPHESFDKIAAPASSWLYDHAAALYDTLLLAAMGPCCGREPGRDGVNEVRDVFEDALNAPPGRLAEKYSRN